MSNPFSDSDSLNDSNLLYPIITNYCCCSCSRALVHTANLTASTAFSNRFLHELTEKDPAMEHVSRVLGKLSVSLHYLASKLIRHILSHGFAFDHYDPGKPAWSGEPSDVVLDGNRDMVENLKVLLEKLKSHKHSMERNLIKKYLKRTNLSLLWDELENLMVGVSEPEKSLALGIESETETEQSINTIDEMKFDPKITSTDKKTVDGSDNKDNDEEILKSKLTGKDKNTNIEINNPPIEIFKSENPPNYLKSEDEVGPEYSKEDMRVKNYENVKIAQQSQMKDSGCGSSILGEKIKDDDKNSSYGSTTNSEDGIEDAKENTTAVTAERMKSSLKKHAEHSGHGITNSEDTGIEDTFAAGKSRVMKKENVEDDEETRYTLIWKKGKDRAKVVFLVSECSSWSSCGLSVTTLFLGLVNWLEKQGMMVLVPKQYLQSKELSGHREFKKLSAWAGEADQLVSEVDLVVCIGGDGSLVRVSHMFQDSMPPVLGFGIGGRNALYSQTWEEEMSKKIILRCLLEEQDIPVMLRARLLVTIANPGEDTVTVTALNEVTVLRGLCPCLAKVQVMVDKTMLYQMEGGGVMVSTPTGSSAYSLSAGGPFVSPTIPCILLTPVACLSIHPSVIPATSTVVLTTSPSSRADSLPVDVDGRNMGQLKENGQVVVTISNNSFPQVMDVDRSTYWREMIRKI